MANVVGSDNDYPSILVTEQASKPTAPASGKQRLYMKTDHKLYHEDSGGTETAVGGGGNVTYESAYASPPTPASGDLWYISDGDLHARYNGSAWQYYWGTKQVVKPVLANFSWFNQGSATIADTGNLTLYTPYTAADNIRGQVMTAPSLNYTIDAIFIASPQAITTFGSYIGWTDGTKMIVFGPGNTNGASARLYLECVKWTNATTFSAPYAGSIDRIPINNMSGIPVFLRIAEDSSNRTCYYSLDYGKNYIQAFQVGRTDFLTATQVGFFLYSNNSAIGQVSMNLLSWKQS